MIGRRLIWFMATLALSTAAAEAQEQAMIDRAVAGAQRTLAAALPHLGKTEFGIPMASYDRAVRRKVVRFDGATKNTPIAFRVQRAGEGSCDRFAAYVEGPGPNLFLCPQFFTPGADALRETTILHEMVHLVGGQGECLAMALTAKIQQLGTGHFQPVSGYWATNNCDRSGYRLPG